MQLSQKQKTLAHFFSSFFKSSFNFGHFQRKLTLIAHVCRKLRTPKNMVRSMPKKSRLRASVEKQHAKCAQTLFKLEGQPPFPYLLITGKATVLQKVPVSDMQNLKTVS